MTRIHAIDAIMLNERQRARLAALGHLREYDGPPKSRAEADARLAEAEVALVSETPLDVAALRGAGRLKMIALWSAGFDHIDVRAAAEQGIVVCNAPGCSAVAIAEHTVAAAIYFTHRLGEADRHVRDRHYSWTAFITPELRGQTFGVIGLGHIGSQVAAHAGALGCQVIAYSRHSSPERGAALGVRLVSLEYLLRESDVISLNCALTPATAGLIGRAQFAQMARRPILINTARGGIVDQAALLEALQGGQVRAAALDVLRDEPPATDEPLLELPNVLFTPHSSGGSRQCFECLSETCVANVEAFLAGKPNNVVNRPA